MLLFGNDRIRMNYNEIVREKQQHYTENIIVTKF